MDPATLYQAKKLESKIQSIINQKEYFVRAKGSKDVMKDALMNYMKGCNNIDGDRELTAKSMINHHINDLDVLLSKLQKEFEAL